MFKCNDCNKVLDHVNYEFWICEHCFKIIEISTTKNWKTVKIEKIDNRFYDYKILKHEILNNDLSKENYLNLIPSLMEGV